MTFCTGCGANLDANSAFCTGCGKLTVAPAENDPSPAEFSPHLPNPVHPAAPAPYPPPRASAGNRVLRALAAALVILMAFAMLQNWLTIHIDMSPRGGGSIAGNFIQEFAGDVLRDLGFNSDEIEDMLSADVDHSMTIHEFNNLTGFAIWFTDFNLEMLDRHARQARVGRHFEQLVRQFEQLISPLDNLPLAVNGIMIAQAVGFASLAIFLFLLLLESKAAGVIGQIASMIVFLIALAFIGAIFFVNSQLDGVANIVDRMGGMGGPMMNLGISLDSSIWVWVTMGLSGISFLLITIFKRAFK